MNRVGITALLVCTVIGLSACGGALKRNSVPGDWEDGLAVYYADSLHGNKTASGEIYDKTALTAAHRHLPFGTVVRVTNLSNRRFVEVRINDRGPFNTRKRIIDLSREAAERIDMIRAGVIRVRVDIVHVPERGVERT